MMQGLHVLLNARSLVMSQMVTLYIGVTYCQPTRLNPSLNKWHYRKVSLLAPLAAVVVKMTQENRKQLLQMLQLLQEARPQPKSFHNISCQHTAELSIQAVSRAHTYNITWHINALLNLLCRVYC